MLNLQVNGSYVIKNGGSDSLQYVKCNRIPQTTRVFSIILYDLMENLDKKQKFCQEHDVDIALSLWCLGLVWIWTGRVGELQLIYNLSLEKKLVWWYVVAYDHVGLHLHILPR